MTTNNGETRPAARLTNRGRVLVATTAAALALAALRAPAEAAAPGGDDAGR